MKIAMINPGLIDIPPKGWGAMEKYIHNYMINLKKLNHQVELRFSNSEDLKDFDIIQSHTWNQSLNLHKRELPYIFSFDDVHPILFGKESDLYKGNKEAMEYSEIVISHSELSMEFFNMIYKTFYLSHGADSDKYKPIENKIIKEHKLLCIANDLPVDRKGFRFAIQAAIDLNLPITIVGPNKNKEFFDKYPDFLKYKKLNVIDNTNENDLIKIYNEHTIFLHPSELETGVPNLTMVESLSCGLPVVGTYTNRWLIDGVCQVNLDVDSVREGIVSVIDNYSNYKEKSIKTSQKYNWTSITNRLLEIYEYVISCRKK